MPILYTRIINTHSVTGNHGPSLVALQAICQSSSIKPINLSFPTDRFHVVFRMSGVRREFPNKFDPEYAKKIIEVHASRYEVKAIELYKGHSCSDKNGKGKTYGHPHDISAS